MTIDLFYVQNNAQGDDLSGLRFDKCDLRDSDLSDSDLRESDLRESDLRWADLRDSNLRWANLSGADLRGANLRGADLSESDLRESNLRGANLRESDLRESDLSDSDLRDSDLRESDLRESDLRWADLRGANLRDSNLRWANLSGADLRDSDLRWADLRESDLRWADLRGVTGLLIPSEFISKNFKIENNCLVVYKIIDRNQYPISKKWKIEKGEFITEIVNSNRTDECGCGVNCATKEWFERSGYKGDVWKCYIHFADLCDIVVPYNTDGKIRCGRLQLIEIVGRK